MIEPLELVTEHDGLTLRQLSTIADDIAYYEAYNASRPEIEAFEPEEVRGKYSNLDEVTDARTNPENANRLRFGIWSGDTFVGSINLTPKEEGAEIGYWLDTRHTGHGYATLATKALANYGLTQHRRLIANVAEGNEASANVLRRSGFTATTAALGSLAFELTRSANKAEPTPRLETPKTESQILMSEYDWMINIVVDARDETARLQGRSMVELLRHRYGPENLKISELAKDPASDNHDYSPLPGRRGVYVKKDAPRLDT